MLHFGLPGLAIAGVLLGLVPVILHLISRRPRERTALPTARFLRPDPRTRIRLRRRPTDPLLLALRCLFVILLVAAFAEPRWIAARSGTVELVVIDPGPATPNSWAAALAQARDRLLDDNGVARGSLAVVGAEPTLIGADRLSAATFDSLGAAQPPPASLDYPATLGAIRRLAALHPAADSARATIVAPLRWSSWSEALSPVRAAAWPGRLEVIEVHVGATDPAEPDRVDDSGRAVVLGGGSASDRVAAALAAVGWSVEEIPDPAAPVPNGTDTVILLEPLGQEPAVRLLEAVRSGVTLVVTGTSPPALEQVLPGTGIATELKARDFVMDEGALLPGVQATATLEPVPAGQVIAAWTDGTPAALAAAERRGCIVYVPARIADERSAMVEAFPRAVNRLARGCDSVERRPDWEDLAHLDRAARAMLVGEGPAVVPLRELEEGGAGRSLFHWLLLAAAGVAVVETLLAYGARRT